MRAVAVISQRTGRLSPDPTYIRARELKRYLAKTLSGIPFF